MAGLRVFVSSTCFDLGAQRSQLRALLTSMGYEPALSEHSDILFDHRIHTHTSCVKEIVNADMVILLIGSRFGGTAIPQALEELAFDEVMKASSKTTTIKDRDRLSITQVEVMKAIEADVPLFAFVDAKVHSDHLLYQKNKDKKFVEEIIYPSIDKPDTAKYIFEFINFLTHRFSNNAITPFSSFIEIEEHLRKQWSMLFQTLLREQREKSNEIRRSDAILEQIQDLKAVLVQSIDSGAAKEIAKNVLKYRRLADIILAMKLIDNDVDALDFKGSFDELLQECGVIDVQFGRDRVGMLRTFLILSDGTKYVVRIPDRRFQELYLEWTAFQRLERDTRLAVIEGVADASATSGTLIYLAEQESDDQPSLRVSEQPVTAPADATLTNGTSTYWTDERIATLREMWSAGQTASQIAETLGDVSRNAVIGKAHRLGLQARPLPNAKGGGT